MKSLRLVHPPPEEGTPEEDSWALKAEHVSKQFEIYMNDRNRVYEFLGTDDTIKNTGPSEM